jgi:1,4-alpha-glucan branching enzyme
VIGYFTFVLHTHLPYVLHHGKWPFGSDWLCEAAAECYIPILNSLNDLDAKGIPAKISMDFSPILLEQLADPEFENTFLTYCDEKIKLAESDYELFAKDEKHFQPLALYWKDFYADAKKRFTELYQSDLVGAFRKLADKGILDAMTCGATHGYFPLLLDDRNIRAQIKLAIATHEKYFGKKPKGIWLPECAYRPRYYWQPQSANGSLNAFKKERAGIEEILAEFGLKYFVVEGSLTKGGSAVPTYDQLLAPVHAKHLQSEEWNTFLFKSEEKKDRSLADIYKVKSTMYDLAGDAPVVFSRDRRTSEQVWSGDIGYPGEPNYLDFHKKHHNSGLRYWKVTGAKVDIGAKEQYDPSVTDANLYRQSEHFVNIVKQTLTEHLTETGMPGVVCSPFDTELFGHWWFEGPGFLEKVLERLSNDPDIILSNCAEIIDSLPEAKTISLPEGSWGEGGGHYVWLNHNVAWTWKEIYELEKRFLDVVDESKSRNKKSKFLKDILKQSARELLLLEASDWQFLITTESAAEYSTKRFKGHAKRLENLLEIAENLLRGRNDNTNDDKKYLEVVSRDDKPFAQINLDWWS